MIRSVVTGGAGFIGSSLVRALLAAGHKVHVIDNLSTGKLDNLEELADRITVYEYDLCDYKRIAPVIADAHRVFHLGALPSVPKSILDPVPSHESNIDGTFNIFRAAAEGKAGRVVYAASSSAYGDSEVLPKVETMTPRPKSPYAVQKLLGEYYAAAFSDCFNLETVSLRFFNVFGPRQDPTSVYSGVLSIFLTCLLERRSPTIYGDGEQSRDFTYVDDVVGLLMKASEAKGVSGKMFNAGNGGRYTLNETWRILQSLEGVKLPAQYGPSRGGDVRHSQADIAAAVEELGHQPRFSFEEGLRLTLDWYRTSLSRPTVAEPVPAAVDAADGFRLDVDNVYRCEAFRTFDWVSHGFGTRLGSPAVNMTLRQVHSNAVFNARGLIDRGCEGDSLTTDETGVAVGVRTADCVPILLVDPRARAVAAIHAGWRGTAGEILLKTIEAMRRDFGTNVSGIRAAIGPCIRQCCYEVGPDVARRFAAYFPDLADAQEARRINLAEANRQQMVSAGVIAGQIFDSGFCTACAAEKFFSYRREPENPGRLVAAICRLA